MRAAFVIAVLLAVPCVPLIPETGSDGASGEMNDPVMLLGSGNNVGGCLYFNDKSIQAPTYFDLNTEGFYKPVVTVTVKAVWYAHKNDGSNVHGDWSGFQGWSHTLVNVEYSWDSQNARVITNLNTSTGQVITGMTSTSSQGSLSFKEVDPYEGFYVVAFSGKPPIQQGPTGCFLIEIEMVVKENDIASSGQKFYFGANLKYHDNGSSGIDPSDPAYNMAYKICLYDANGQEMDPAELISVRHRENEGPYQARVILMENNAVIPPSDRRYDDYLYYSSELPDGLNMKSDGTIEGKLAGYTEATEVTFTIYGINKDYTTDRVS